MLHSSKDLLQDLLRLSSVNPTFGSGSKQELGESALADFLIDFFQTQGWPWLRQSVHPGRDNCLALVTRNPSERSEPLLWQAHQDTVGTEGMTIDPFGGAHHDGRIWGRGACDVKGGLAAMLAAASRLSKQETHQRPNILLAFTVNEEAGFTGSRALGHIWDDSVSIEQLGALSGPLSIDQLRTYRPARAIVAEPTSLNVVVAHQGVVRWRCSTQGRAVHSSRPDEGVNAIYTMSSVVQAIETLHLERLSQGKPHPLCGTPSVCVSTIHGGTGVSTVPDHAVIDIDRRLSPDEHPQAAIQELIEWVSERLPTSEAVVDHQPPWLQSSGLDNTDNQSWAAELSEVVSGFNLPCQHLGEPYCTDAPALAACGIPTVVWGPGAIAQAHTDDEWIEVAELELAEEILVKLGATALD